MVECYLTAPDAFAYESKLIANWRPPWNRALAGHSRPTIQNQPSFWAPNQTPSSQPSVGGPAILNTGQATRQATTCREAILDAIPAVMRSDGTFTQADLVRELQRRGTQFSLSTIRTHLSSRMRADAPQNHAVKYDDLVGIADGVLRLLDHNAGEERYGRRG